MEHGSHEETYTNQQFKHLLALRVALRDEQLKLAKEKKKFLKQKTAILKQRVRDDNNNYSIAPNIKSNEAINNHGSVTKDLGDLGGAPSAIPFGLNPNHNRYVPSVVLKINKTKLAKKMKEFKLVATITSDREFNRIQYDANDRIILNGITYAVIEGGAKLIPLDFPKGSPLPNRDEIEWDGAIYVGRSSGILRQRNKKSKLEQCRYYMRAGICGRANQCRFRHDQHRIKACTGSLQGHCNNINCLLSHRFNQYNTPLCTFFLGNGCKNRDCRFLHRRPPHYGDPDYEVWICRPFAVGGSCPRGMKCPLVHLPRCPDFEETGSCPRESHCSLEHAVTRRHQRLMATRDRDPNDDEDDSESNVKDEDDSVEITPDDPIVINSFTLSRDALLMSANGKDNNQYDVYVDEASSKSELYGKQFTIQLHSDDLEENIDYVGLKT